MPKFNMKLSSTLAAIVIGLFTLLSGCSGGSSEASHPQQGPEQAAKDGLVTLRELATGLDFEFYGYKSEGDVGREALGKPLLIKTLDFERLASTDVYNTSLIIDADEYLYPVYVNNETITGIRVGRMTDGTWGLVATEADATDFDAADEAIKSHSFDRSSCYLLDLEEIELLILGCERRGELKLVPLYTPSEAFEIDREYRFTEIIGSIKSELLAQKNTDPNIPPIVGLLDAPSIPYGNVASRALSPLNAATETDQALINSKLLRGVSLIGQMQGQWCWAATAEMTMKFAAGTAPSQCSQATKAQDTYDFSKQPSKRDCCLSENAGSKFCNNPWYPEYENWAFKSSYINKAPTWKELKFLIDGNKPLAFLWRWKPVSDGNAHYMVAVGYKTVSSKNFVQYLDPWPVGKGKKVAVPFDEWIGGQSSNYDHVFGIYFTEISR